eukprot:1218363-Amphidinium_carterae.1
MDMYNGDGLPEVCIAASTAILLTNMAFRCAPIPLDTQLASFPHTTWVPRQQLLAQVSRHGKAGPWFTLKIYLHLRQTRRQGGVKHICFAANDHSRTQLLYIRTQPL